MLAPNQQASYGSDNEPSDAEGYTRNSITRTECVLLFEDPMPRGSINFIQP